MNIQNTLSRTFTQPLFHFSSQRQSRPIDLTRVPFAHRFICFFPVAISLCAVLFCTTTGLCQSNPQRDASALSFLSQALTAAGGSAAIAGVTDFTANGSITYSWGDPVQGTTTIKSRGLTQFRLDSEVPDGTWSFIVNNGAGVLNLPNGTSSAVPYQGTLNADSLTLPIILISAAVGDTSVTVIDGGLVPLGNGQARQITIQQNLSASIDPNGQLSTTTKRDYFFDPVSSLLLQVQDTVYPNNDVVNGGVPRIIGFSGYQMSNGIYVPFSISVSLDGQTLWSIQLTSINFNSGLSDSDFQF